MLKQKIIELGKIMWPVLAISAPVWLPTLGGFIWSGYSEIFGRPKEKVVNFSAFALAAIAFIAGNAIVLQATHKSCLGSLFALVSYSLVAIFVLFWSGWGLLLLAGYGY